MDTFLTITSRREVRDYTTDDLPEDAVDRILTAGRVAGSSKNTQPCRFTVIDRGSDLIPALAKLVTRPTNITGGAMLIAVTTVPGRKTMFDAGRTCQNMMLAGWSEGIGSCPNTVKEPERLKSLLEIPEEEEPVLILSFGYPSDGRDPHSRPAEIWAKKLNRLPPEDVIRRR